MQAFRKSPAFQPLSDQLLWEICLNAREVQFDEGEAIVMGGQSAPGLFVITDGTACVTLTDDATRQSIILNHLGNGDVLGEMSLMTGRKCAATVRATSTVRALHLTSRDCHRMTHDSGEFSLACMKLLSTRLGRSDRDAFCGKEIGDYRFLDVVGRGASGIAYRARHSLSQLTVVTKMLNPALRLDVCAVTRFQREAEMLRRLHHPNIIRLLDEFHAANSYFLVTEYCPGGSLKELIDQKGRVPLQQLKAIVTQVIGALRAAHSCGIVHRDLKPSNILIGDGLNARLGDFGIAVSEGEGGLTDHQTLIGTPRYMAPEQLAFERATPAADLFALGCVAYEMATGQVLFDGQTYRQLVMQHLSWSSGHSSLQNIADPQLRSFLSNALEVDPMNRVVDLSLLE